MQTTTSRALILAVAASVGLLAQTPAEPTFDVVSIKRNRSNAIGAGGSVPQRPDGGFMMLNVPIAYFIAQAYSVPPVDMVGLPGWATAENYDVSATSSLTRATPAQRTAMLRGMLAERVRLAVRLEPREQPVYDLVLARPGGTLGPGIARSGNDCEARLAGQRAAAEAAMATGTVPPTASFPDPKAPVTCATRYTGDLMESDNTMTAIASLFRASAGRVVVDKTGLTGTYRMTLRFQRAVRGPETVAAPDAAPTIFTAVQEQLGMKLESSTALRDVLIIERIERPAEN